MWIQKEFIEFDKFIDGFKMCIVFMAHFHQKRRTRIRIRIRIPNPIITLYDAQLFPLVQIPIRIPVWIVSQTVPILEMDLRTRDPNPNPSLLVEMSHYT